MAYEVKLENFNGPFDLLCHLIEEAQLDICAVSLAQVVDQYLEYVQAAADDADLDAVGEFLVMAARLLLLKARVLLSAGEPETEDLVEENPEELVDHLREYKVFRDAAQELARLMDAEADYFSSPGTRLDAAHGPRVVQPPAIDPAELLAAWRRMAPLFVPPRPVAVSLDTHPVQKEITRLMRRLRQVQALEFRRYVGPGACPAQLVAAFLAVLELWHQDKVTVWQRALFDEIIIARREEKTCG